GAGRRRGPAPVWGVARPGGAPPTRSGGPRGSSPPPRPGPPSGTRTWPATAARAPPACPGYWPVTFRRSRRGSARFEQVVHHGPQLLGGGWFVVDEPLDEQSVDTREEHAERHLAAVPLHRGQHLEPPSPDRTPP